LPYTRAIRNKGARITLIRLPSTPQSPSRHDRRSNSQTPIKNGSPVSNSALALEVKVVDWFNTSQTPRFAEQAECNWIPGNLHGSQPIDPELVWPFADLLPTTAKKASNI